MIIEMKQKLGSFKHKVPMALRGIAGVMKRPKYIGLATMLAGLFALLMYFFIQIGFYGPLMTSRLSLVDKVATMGMMASDMAIGFATNFEGMLLAVVALLQGVAFAVMIYTIRRNKRFDKSTVGSGGMAMVAAALGLGCVPCGTSLIMPIVTLFFSSSAYAVANTASQIVLIVAFGLSIYSLYKLGLVAYPYAVMENESEESSGEPTGQK